MVVGVKGCTNDVGGCSLVCCGVTCGWGRGGGGGAAAAEGWGAAAVWKAKGLYCCGAVAANC